MKKNIFFVNEDKQYKIMELSKQGQKKLEKKEQVNPN